MLFPFFVWDVLGVPLGFIVGPAVRKGEPVEMLPMAGGGRWLIAVLLSGSAYFFLPAGDFVMWALVVIAVVVASRTEYQQVVAGFATIFTLGVVAKNLHTIARSSVMADIEENPGPAWHDDPLVHERRAVVGSVKQQQDVRVVLLLVGIPLSKLEPEVQAFMSNNATAAYYRRVQGSLQPAGDSAAAVAKAFRAVYFGSYRRDYVRYVIGSRDIDLRVLATVKDTVAEIVGENTGMAGGEPSAKLRALESAPGKVDELTTEFDGISVGDSFAPGGVKGTTPKMYCTNCSFLVNPDGHELRCGRGGSSDNTVAAWLGDALHTLDVRAALVRGGVNHRELTVVATSYTSAVAQERYMLSVSSPKELGIPGNSSSRTFSNTFEQCYKGEFRRNYLLWLAEDVAHRYPPDEVYNVTVGDYTSN
jgi:hypothetical protein